MSLSMMTPLMPSRCAAVSLQSTPLEGLPREAKRDGRTGPIEDRRPQLETPLRSIGRRVSASGKSLTSMRVDEIIRGCRWLVRLSPAADTSRGLAIYLLELRIRAESYGVEHHRARSQDLPMQAPRQRQPAEVPVKALLSVSQQLTGQTCLLPTLVHRDCRLHGLCNWCDLSEICYSGHQRRLFMAIM
jgi:hypothetical protein